MCQSLMYLGACGKWLAMPSSCSARRVGCMTAWLAVYLCDLLSPGDRC